MGMHTGVHHPSEVSLNRVRGQVQYTGPCAAAAKAVSSAAVGGMVLLTQATFERVRGMAGWLLGAAACTVCGSAGVLLVLPVVPVLPDGATLWILQSRTRCTLGEESHSATVSAPSPAPPLLTPCSMHSLFSPAAAAT